MQRWEEIAYAKAEGVEEGRMEGIAEGMAKGMAKGIIETCLEFGLAEYTILEKLQDKLGISPEKAQEYLAK